MLLHEYVVLNLSMLLLWIVILPEGVNQNLVKVTNSCLPLLVVSFVISNEYLDKSTMCFLTTAQKCLLTASSWTRLGDKSNIATCCVTLVKVDFRVSFVIGNMNFLTLISLRV